MSLKTVGTWQQKLCKKIFLAGILKQKKRAGFGSVAGSSILWFGSAYPDQSKRHGSGTLVYTASKKTLHYVIGGGGADRTRTKLNTNQRIDTVVGRFFKKGTFMIFWIVFDVFHLGILWGFRSFYLGVSWVVGKENAESLILTFRKFKPLFNNGKYIKCHVYLL